MRGGKNSLVRRARGRQAALRRAGVDSQLAAGAHRVQAWTEGWVRVGCRGAGPAGLTWRVDQGHMGPTLSLAFSIRAAALAQPFVGWAAGCGAGDCALGKQSWARRLGHGVGLWLLRAASVWDPVARSQDRCHPSPACCLLGPAMPPQGLLVHHRSTR